MLHAGGQGVHAGCHRTDSEPGADGRVRVEQQHLDHLQNVTVPAEGQRRSAEQQQVDEVGRPVV